MDFLRGKYSLDDLVVLTQPDAWGAAETLVAPALEVVEPEPVASRAPPASPLSSVAPRSPREAVGRATLDPARMTQESAVEDLQWFL